MAFAHLRLSILDGSKKISDDVKNQHVITCMAPNDSFHVCKDSLCAAIHLLNNGLVSFTGGLVMYGIRQPGYLFSKVFVVVQT